MKLGRNCGRYIELESKQAELDMLYQQVHALNCDNVDLIVEVSRLREESEKSRDESTAAAKRLRLSLLKRSSKMSFASLLPDDGNVRKHAKQLIAFPARRRSWRCGT